MKLNIRALKILVVTSLILHLSIIGQNNNDKDRLAEFCGTPYLEITNDQEGSLLLLDSTGADVSILGTIADVTLTQVYKNTGSSAIEGVYVFPASTHAAVYSMKMTVGDRVIQAKIQEKEQARKTYEQAKSQGKSAALLEQKRPNVFQMKVAQIMPDESIRIELSYTEMLIPEDNEYSFVFPTVVGPRYHEESSDMVTMKSNEQDWIYNPFITDAKKPGMAYSLNLSLNAGMPIAQSSCKTHKSSTIDYTGKNQLNLALTSGESFEWNKDFIFNYRLAENKIQSGVITFNSGEEKFFSATIQPPKRNTAAPSLNREYIFVVDVSGSMNGFPLNISKNLMNNLLSGLTAEDEFNIMLFAGGSRLFSEQSVPATAANIKNGLSFINRSNGGGGTQLLPALKRAIQLPKEEGRSRSTVIVTDGYVSVEKEAFDLIRTSLSQSNFFAFGIGSSVNRYLIEGLAKAGNGEPLIITNSGEAGPKADKFTEYIKYPILTDIKYEAQGVELYDVEPLSVADVLANRPITIVGKYKGKAPGKLIITGKSANGSYRQEVALASNKDETNKALKYLWARKKLERISDFASKGSNKDEIIELGLKYNLLSEYTSFVAVDSYIKNETGEIITVNQALPLPEGVSSMAVSAYSSNKSLNFKTVEYSAPLIQREEVNAIPPRQIEELDISDMAVMNQAPHFIGGKKALENYIQKHLSYPEALKKSGVEGTVYIQATVNKKGELMAVKVKKGIHPLLDQEALNLVKGMPNWAPGMQGKNAVRATIQIPIEFKL